MRIFQNLLKIIIIFPLRFNYKLKKSKPKLPSLKISSGFTENKELIFQSEKGLQNRLKNFILQKKYKS